MRKVNAQQYSNVWTGSGALALRQAATGVAVQNASTFSNVHSQLCDRIIHSTYTVFHDMNIHEYQQKWLSADSNALGNRRHACAASRCRRSSVTGYVMLRKVNAKQNSNVWTGSGALASRQAAMGVAVHNASTFSNVHSQLCGCIIHSTYTASPEMNSREHQQKWLSADSNALGNRRRTCIGQIPIKMAAQDNNKSGYTRTYAGRIIHSAYSVLYRINARQHSSVLVESGTPTPLRPSAGASAQRTGTFAMPARSYVSALSTTHTRYCTRKARTTIDENERIARPVHHHLTKPPQKQRRRTSPRQPSHHPARISPETAALIAQPRLPTPAVSAARFPHGLRTLPGRAYVLNRVKPF